MVAAPQFGQIVWASIADANGICKMRPAVVVTPTAKLTSSREVELVAITSTLPSALPPDHVLLPWHPRGHPRTGLNRKCEAVCSWITPVSQHDIQSASGIVLEHLVEIMSRIAEPKPECSPSPEENSGQSNPN